MFRDMDEGEIAGLAQSIKEHGIMHPLLVRPSGDGYQIISGRQRHRAAALAGLCEVPCTVVEADDQKAEMMLIDANVQTRHLSPMEVARAVRRKKVLAGIENGRRDAHSTSAQCAEDMGMSERQFYKLDRLNDLIPPLQDLVDQGRLGVTAGERLSRLAAEVQESLYGALGDSIADITGEEARRLRDESDRGHQVLSLLDRELQRLRQELQEIEEKTGDKSLLEERLRELRRQKADLEYDVMDRQASMAAVRERETKQGVALYNLLQQVAREVQAVKPEIETLLRSEVSDALSPYIQAWGLMFHDLGRQILAALPKQAPSEAHEEVAR